MGFFFTQSPKFVRNHKRSQITKAILWKMDKAEGIMCSDFKLYYKAGWSPREGNGNPLQYSCLENPMDRRAWQSTGSQRVKHNWATNTNNTIVKIVWYWHKNRHIDQRDKTERQEINPYIQGQLISNERAKNTRQGQDSLFNKWRRKTGQPQAKESNWMPILYHSQ